MAKSLVVFSKKNIWTTLFTALTSCLTAVSIISIFSVLVIKQVSDPLTYIDKTQITVYAFPESNKKMTSDKAKVIENYLTENKSIESFEKVSDEKIRSLMNRFIKFNKITENLQLPIVFQVLLSQETSITHHDLEFALNNKAENVFVESKNDSIKALSSKVLGIKGVLTLIPFLMLFALLSSVGIFVAVIINLHKKELNILLFLGTTVARISREYSFWIASITLKGSFIGVLLGILLSLIVAFVFKLVIAISFLINFLLILLFVPFIFAILTHILASIVTFNLSYKMFQK